MDKVKVFITDWQILFREGIHFTLSGEEDFEVIGEATNNQEAFEFIEKNPPGLAILNADRTQPSGIEVTRRIQKNLPAVKVILIMDKYNDEQLFAAVKSGASACLSKDMDPEELLNIIRKVVRSESPISQTLLEPNIASRIIAEFESSAQLNDEIGNVLAILLPYEGQVLHYIINGNLPEEIARSLDITEEKVKQCLDIILDKLVVNDRIHEVIDIVQGNLNSVISRISKTKRTGKQTTEYITKEEFNSFKEGLMEKFRSLFGDQS